MANPSWAEICDEELSGLSLNSSKEPAAPSKIEEKEKEEVEEKKEKVEEKEEKAEEKQEDAKEKSGAKNLFDEFEKLNKAVHAGLFVLILSHHFFLLIFFLSPDVTAAVEHDPQNPPEKEPKIIESFYDLKTIKPALMQTIITSGFDRPSPVQVCFVLFCFVLFCFVLFCFVLFCFVLFCFVLFCYCFVIVLLLFCYCFVIVLLLFLFAPFFFTNSF